MQRPLLSAASVLIQTAEHVELVGELALRLLGAGIEYFLAAPRRHDWAAFRERGLVRGLKCGRARISSAALKLLSSDHSAPVTGSGTDHMSVTYAT